MIKNFIFDFGKVLVHFDPLYMVGKYTEDAEDAALVADVVFDRLYWDRLDAGTISDEEVVESSLKRLPERLHKCAACAYYNWIYNIPEVEGMRELVTHIKQRYGARVFLLSNISTYFAEHKDEIPCLAEFEHCVFSAVVGMVKPSKEIFEYICEIGGILPEESLFVDDNAANIAGAEKCGIEGYLFDGDVAALKAYLNSVL
jgi:putative hydrolase of the HAD superfamily